MKHTFATIVVIAFICRALSADDFLLYQESFETGLEPGGVGDVGDVGWDIGNSLENSGIWYPDVGDFVQTTPLESPADGNQVLFIDDFGDSGGPHDNTFVAVNTRIVIEEGATYTVTAATGFAVDGVLGDQSIQAWSTADGTIDSREFIGQSFTTHNWNDAEEGRWIDNSYSFIAGPNETEKELIILVTNFNSDCCGIPGGVAGPVYWDNFRVTGDVPPRDALMAGDSDQDLDFDQIDLVRVQIAAKYLTGQSATWGQGDWDGAPGGKPGSPPVGNGLFDQRDIIAALNSGAYLTGPYAALVPNGVSDDGQTSIGYDPSTGELWVDAPAAVELTSINIDSASGVFTGQAAQNLGGSFDNDADGNLFKATFGGSFGSLSFGNVAHAGLSEQFLIGDLSVVGSLAGGGALGNVDLIYLPEPTTSVLMLIAVSWLNLIRRPR